MFVDGRRRGCKIWAVYEDKMGTAYLLEILYGNLPVMLVLSVAALAVAALTTSYAIHLFLLH